MTEDKNLKELVSGLTKFLERQDEYDLVRSHLTEGDLAGELMKTLGIPADDVRVLIGGSNSPIFKRAADEIVRLRNLVGRAVKGLKNIGEFHYHDDESGVEPHTLDCTLAGRVSRVFCTGMTRSCELCREFGENPEYSEASERKRIEDQ